MLPAGGGTDRQTQVRHTAPCWLLPCMSACLLATTKALGAESPVTHRGDCSVCSNPAASVIGLCSSRTVLRMDRAWASWQRDHTSSPPGGGDDRFYRCTAATWTSFKTNIHKPTLISLLHMDCEVFKGWWECAWTGTHKHARTHTHTHWHTQTHTVTRT